MATAECLHFLVKKRVVKFVHAIFGEADELLGGVVAGEGLGGLGVLLLPLLGGLTTQLNKLFSPRRDNRQSNMINMEYPV